MNKPLKLHLACGTVYLKGWTNIDIEGELAKDRPDLIEINGTTVDNYYKEEVTKDDFISGKFHKKEKVVDIKSDLFHLQDHFEDNTVDEMLGVQILEHFSLLEAKELLKIWYRLLRKGGSLTLHVPDVEGIIEECLTYDTYGEVVAFEVNDWIIRQLWGSQKDQWSIHKYGYTTKSLKKLLKEIGFVSTRQVKAINNYSSIGIKAIK